MSTPAQLSANRANALLSTGPKTQQGKQRSSQNRISHGLYATALILPNEDPSLLAELRQNYIQTLAPQNLLELNLLDQIIAAHWRLQRIHKAEALLHGALYDRAQVFIPRSLQPAYQTAAGLPNQTTSTHPPDNRKSQDPPPACATLLAAVHVQTPCLERLSRLEH